MSKKANGDILWQGRKRNAIGLPLTFTKYILYSNKLVYRKGFLNIVEDEVDLYKIRDKQLKISLMGRIFHYGTIILFASSDYQENVLKNIHGVRNVAKILEENINRERDKYRVRGRDMIGNIGHTSEDDGDTDDGNDFNDDDNA